MTCPRHRGPENLDSKHCYILIPIGFQLTSKKPPKPKAALAKNCTWNGFGTIFQFSSSQISLNVRLTASREVSMVLISGMIRTGQVCGNYINDI